MFSSDALWLQSVVVTLVTTAEPATRNAVVFVLPDIMAKAVSLVSNHIPVVSIDACSMSLVSNHISVVSIDACSMSLVSNHISVVSIDACSRSLVSNHIPVVSIDACSMSLVSNHIPVVSIDACSIAPTGACSNGVTAGLSSSQTSVSQSSLVCKITKTYQCVK